MEIIREFNKISKNDVAMAGGKGASLGEMTQAKIPVPQGYIILADAFEELISVDLINKANKHFWIDKKIVNKFFWRKKDKKKKK